MKMSSSSMSERIRELLSKGASLYEIEREVGIEPKEVVKEVLRLGRIPRSITKLDMFIYLHERGASREEVMEAMGLTKEGYYGYRSKARSVRGYRFPRRKSRLEEAVEYLREGLSVDEIAQRMGIKRYSVMHLISQARRRGLVKTRGKGRSYEVKVLV